ncbi:phosphotransferase [Alkaliphilus peptidifermentans]|uniref:phosphotransferase n=1 Tax=Alkaliphilus peptidifermentans TaxID=426129 RepID=UPI0015A2A94B|nr:phosphotransferase [Alkaliphilus peptidifermentans]
MREVKSSKIVKQVKVNNGKTYYLKLKESIDEIERELYLQTTLKKYNVPTSMPLISVDNLYYTFHNEDIYCLYEELPGSHVTDFFNLEQVYLIGEALSRLHIGLEHCNPNMFNTKNMDIMKQLIEWAIPESKKLDKNINNIEEYLISNFFPNINSLSKQIIHRDTHPQNILFDNKKLSGFIDFDISTVGFRIFDLCYCSTAILMSDFSNQKLKNEWLNIFKHLYEGYTSNITLSNVEIKSLFPILLSIQLIFIAFFKDRNEDIARINLEGLYWIYKNKDKIEKALITIA